MLRQSARRLAAPLGSTPLRLGMSQLQDVPETPYRPNMKATEEQPAWNEVNDNDRRRWQLMKRLQLEMGEEWDELEAYRELPKPKVLLGNEACHAIWPYALLLERQIPIHHFTKSIYVYYPQNSLTSTGEVARLVAREFSYEYLVPITFHNPQCYVETELLVEYGDTPWIVVNCLDGNQTHVAITPELLRGVDWNAPTIVQVQQGHRAVLNAVLAAAETLGSSVQDPKSLMQELHLRPNQHGYVRVDYQWFGDTPEERHQHLVQWTEDDAAVQPQVYDRAVQASTWMQFQGHLPQSQSLKDLVHRSSKGSMQRPDFSDISLARRHIGTERNNATWGGFAGKNVA